jgi:hypothetical protein
MAFFKLTMLGSQNKLQEAKIEGSGVTDQDQLEKQLKEEFASQQINEFGNGPSGSYTKYSLIRQKHIRNPKGISSVIYIKGLEKYKLYLILSTKRDF